MIGPITGRSKAAEPPARGRRGGYTDGYTYGDRGPLVVSATKKSNWDHNHKDGHVKHETRVGVRELAVLL